MLNIPKLGFGLMRLPSNNGEIDIEQFKRMVDIFMENGFTYFDTAWGYANGKSEEAAKIALIDRYPREKFQFATKLPAWMGVNTEEEAKEMFWTSLRRTGAGYFDFYLLHNLGDGREEYFDRFKIWDFAAELKEKGLVKHVGFSFHDRADLLDKILTEHPESEFVQLQINYADWDDITVQSRKCLEVARAHGKPVVVMEPVKGGLLAKLPEEAAAILREADPEASQASWAVRFAASQDNIITVLSGMSNIEQMENNVSFMRDFKPLTPEEYKVLDRVNEVLGKGRGVPCTDCRYCMKGCPMGIKIPHIFEALNRAMIFNNIGSAKNSYNWETKVGGKVEDCVECGACERVCPQHIAIRENLKKAAEMFK